MSNHLGGMRSIMIRFLWILPLLITAFAAHAADSQPNYFNHYCKFDLGECSWVDYDPKSDRFLAVFDKRIVIWKRDDLTAVETVKHTGSGEYMRSYFRPDGSILVLGKGEFSVDMAPQLKFLVKNRLAGVWRTDYSRTVDCAVSAGGSCAEFVNRDGKTLFFGSGTEIGGKSVLVPISQVAVRDHSSFYFVRDISGRPRALKMATLKPNELQRDEKITEFEEAYINALCFDAKADNVILGLDDSTIVIWSVKQKKLLKTLESKNRTVLQLAITGDGKHLFSFGTDVVMELWDLQQMKLVSLFKTPQLRPIRLIAGEDASFCCELAVDGTLHCWRSIKGLK